MFRSYDIMVLHVAKDYKANYTAALTANVKKNYIYTWLKRRMRTEREELLNVSSSDRLYIASSSDCIQYRILPLSSHPPNKTICRSGLHNY